MKANKHQKKTRLKYVGAYVPIGLYTKIREEAEANHRTIAGELRARLQKLTTGA
jgi:hypothetical protein